MFGLRKKLSDAELVAAVKAEAAKFFNGKQGSHDWDHTLRVLENCRAIGNELAADMTSLELAAYLHDIGRAEESKSRGKVSHAQIGAQVAQKILKKLGADKERTNAVVYCVGCHRSKGDLVPESLEAKILFDADKLDALGAIGIVRLFLFANEVGAGIHNKETDLAKTDAYSSEDTAFREFYLSVRFLKEKMMTDPGKRLAKSRHDFMVEYFARFFEEVGASKEFFIMLDEIRSVPRS